MTHADFVQRAFESQLVRARAGLSKLPTVASVAAAAHLSRSSLYRYHPSVVGQIRTLSHNRNANRDEQLRLKLRLLIEQLRREKEASSSLARACAELAAAKAASEAQLEDEKLGLQLRIDHLENALQGRKNVRVLRP